MSSDAASPPAAPGWGARLLRVPLVRIVIALLFIAIPFAVVALPFNLYVTDRLVKRLGALLLAAVVFIAYTSYVRSIEHRPATELSKPRAVRELGAGMLLGALLLALTIGVLAVLGVYQVTGSNGWAPVIATVPAFVLAAVLEEVVMRGIVFRILEQWLGSWIALACSAALFGLLHLINPGATLLNAGAIMLEAGVMLAAAFMLTRRLWLCIGIHFAWNFTQGGIFSGAVSGGVAPGLLQARVVGPQWLTGGAFGVEASVVALVLCSAAGLLLLTAARRRDRIISYRAAQQGSTLATVQP
jgi:hypothetical protein